MNFSLDGDKLLGLMGTKAGNAGYVRWVMMETLFLWEYVGSCVLNGMGMW
jgi:hypothetical protein